MTKSESKEFINYFISNSINILERLDKETVEQAIEILSDARNRGGRLFVLGVGGSAANASHAVNDFRKLAGFEAYAPTDNVSELTARVNDEGWVTVFQAWLCISRLSAKDLVIVLSVGGGSLERNISSNLVRALQYAKEVGARIIGIVGRDGGYTAQVANVCIIIPTVDKQQITPQTESFQAVILHLMVSHPQLKIAPTKWESIQ
jgi:D-sedoheptulose 7-phosphate isomerase